MERVTFKIAKYLKKIGYPQYPLIPCYQDDIIKEFIEKREDICDNVPTYACPMYIEVWIWLCDHISYIDKRKLLSISIFKGRIKWELSFNCGCLDSDDDDGCDYEFIGNTQEEVIIKAIEYLVDNDLIK